MRWKVPIITVKDQLDNLGNGTGSGGIVSVFFQ